MTPLENIRQGLILQDWSYIQQGYLQLTGETIQIKLKDIDSDYNIFIDELLSLMNKHFDYNNSKQITNNKIDEEILEDEEEFIEEDIPEIKIKNEKYTGEFKPPKKMVAITNEFGVDLEQQKINKEKLKANVEKQQLKRKPKKTSLISCTNCNKNFDSFAHIEKTSFSEKNRGYTYKCPHCKTLI